MSPGEFERHLAWAMPDLDPELLGWIREYNGPGPYGRKKLDGMAQHVYKRLQNPDSLVALIAAVGFDGETVAAARRAAQTAKGNASHRSKAVRIVVPWPMFASQLRDQSQRASARDIAKYIDEAPDDVIEEVALALRRRVRRGQSQFRDNLIALYEGRCAISGWAPEVVLEAAHIEGHAETGSNASDNGILLRADLHALFDEHLLRIDSETLEVVVDQSLQSTPYWEFHGKAIRPRRDGGHPSKERLATRWARVAAGR